MNFFWYICLGPYYTSFYRKNILLYLPVIEIFSTSTGANQKKKPLDYCVKVTFRSNTPPTLLVVKNEIGNLNFDSLFSVK